MATATFVRPDLYDKQFEAFYCEERYGITEASTKAGKTVAAMAWITEQCMLGKAGQNFWWVSPGYNQSDIAFRRLKLGLSPGSFTPFESPTPRLLMASGAMLWFKSGDNADALYGEDVFGAVIDEASRVKEDCWYAIRSTLTATNGRIRIIGNVKGRKNWFYGLARRAEAMMLEEPDPSKRSMHYSKITAADAVAAGVITADEVEDARQTLPDNVFRELYYAEPGDDTGNPFGPEHILACTRDKLAPGPAVAFGVDIAKSVDYFVVIGLNEAGGVCIFERWNKIPWGASIDRTRGLVGEDAAAYVDSTGVGDPVLEQLQKGQGNFVGYHFSATAKQKIMEGLAVAIQRHEISFPDGFIRQELENFEYEFTARGVKYAAMEGLHDDCVCALALAVQAWSTTAPGANMMKFYELLANASKPKSSLPEVAEVDKRRAPDDLTREIASTFENELAEIYNEGMKSAGLNQPKLCQHCGEEVSGPSRVTDGEFVWHPDCAGGRRNAA